MFLMPSRFEPCGLGQMIAMHYGALPIVRHTGGLVDTVPEFSPDLVSGNGFVFHDYTPGALAEAVIRATQVFQEQGFLEFGCEESNESGFFLAKLRSQV